MLPVFYRHAMPYVLTATFQISRSSELFKLYNFYTQVGFAVAAFAAGGI
jgi:hypothetical protein